MTYNNLSIKKISIYAFANALINPDTVSGGDQHFLKCFKYWKLKGISIFVQTPCVGIKLFKQYGIEVRLDIIPGKFFDEFGVTVSYLVRSMVSPIYSIFKKPDVKFLYSTSDFLPDTLPAFVLKTIWPKYRWIGNVFHLIPPPPKRKGPIVRNTLSFVAQRLSLSLLKKADQIHVDNKGLIDKLNKMGFKNKVKLIRMGLEFKNSFKKIDDSYDACFVGRLDPTKGIFDLLTIWSLVCKKDDRFKLAVIGAYKSEIFEKVTSFVKKNKLGENINFLGFVPEEEKVAIMKGSKVFVFPSREEGWGIVVAESLACGTPVIAWDLPVYRELFLKGVVLTPIDEYEVFTKNIFDLLGSEKKLKRLGRQGKLWVKKYEWGKVANDELDLIKSLTNEDK